VVDLLFFLIATIIARCFLGVIHVVFYSSVWHCTSRKMRSYIELCVICVRVLRASVCVDVCVCGSQRMAAGCRAMHTVRAQCCIVASTRTDV
jgi:hypothetical protein